MKFLCYACVPCYPATFSPNGLIEKPELPHLGGLWGNVSKQQEGHGISSRV